MPIAHYEDDDAVTAKLFALQTGLVMLAACLSDRFEKGELRARLEACADEADMRGAETRFLATSDLLRAMAANLELGSAQGPAAAGQHDPAATSYASSPSAST